MQNYHYFTIYNNTNVDYVNTDVEKHLKHASALISTSAGFESVGNDANYLLQNCIGGNDPLRTAKFATPRRKV